MIESVKNLKDVIILTVFYWAMSWYFRSLARGALEEEWIEEGHTGGGVGGELRFVPLDALEVELVLGEELDLLEGLLGLNARLQSRVELHEGVEGGGAGLLRAQDEEGREARRFRGVARQVGQRGRVDLEVALVVARVLGRQK